MKTYKTSDRIRALMIEKNWKQVDIIKKSIPFQEKLGIKLGKSALSQYVNGVQSPNQKKLSLLALTFNVSEAWLMGYEVPKEREFKTSTTFVHTGYDLKHMIKIAKRYDSKPLKEKDKDAIISIIEIYLKGKD